MKFASAHLDKIEKRTVFHAQKEVGVGRKSLKPEPTDRGFRVTIY